MKKTIAVFILLLILAGTGLVLGWVQRAVPPGSYGILRSKTHGIDRQLIREGEFRWVWYTLIPSNAKISVYSLDPVSRELSVKGSLPSGDLFGSLEGVSVDFSYEVNGSFSFNIKPASLISLMTQRGIADQAGLDAFEESTAGEIAAFAVQRLKVYAEETEEMETLAETSASQVKADIERAFPNIENLSLSVTAARFPDYTLYRSMRSLYETYIRQQQESLHTGTIAAAENRVKFQLRLDELTGYGELLTKYPILLKYLAIERGSGTVISEILREEPAP
jgi:hypothetical protein